MQIIVISVSVCLSVCLSVSVCFFSVCLSVYVLLHTSNIIHPISSNFLHVLQKAVARSSCDGSTMTYVLPVLWTTSIFHIR